ncbi:MAG: double zinc ribbon domain-containing protein [Alphaproteobacteria bacterium]
MSASLRPPPGLLRSAARRAVDLVYPPLCLRCQAPVAEQGALCGACWGEVSFVVPPFCAVCALPFEFHVAPGALCGACTASPPAFARARSVCLYDEASRGLVLSFKHGGRLEGIRAMARWMARAADGLLEEDTVLAPVPLYRWRLWRRGFNQSALLARALARLTGAEANPLALQRVRATPSQAGLSRAARIRNVAGAFRVRPGQAETLKERPVVIVDDVLTTGATVEACAKTVLKAGARSASVLTFARALPPGS